MTVLNSYTYQCSECWWEGPQEEVGIASSDEGTHCWVCPACGGHEVELKGDENDDSSREG